MEKLITFSNEDKSLIWSRVVQPVNGTEEESNHFISYCEQFGLNPLLDDVVFQRRESKYGPKTQFITKRDALLRLASKQPNYVGAPNSAVVKEGDEFEFLPAEGTVKHKFGSKRGEILGAYAIMKHKKHDPVAVFVDFPEYFQANSGKINSKYGNGNVWDSMPSAMISKVAEVFVLKRQFPLGGIQTQEEMGLEDADQTVTELSLNSDNTAATKAETANHESVSEEQSSIEEENQNFANKMKESFSHDHSQKTQLILKAFELRDAPSGTAYGICDVVETDTNKPMKVMVKGKEEIEVLEKLSPETLINVSVYKENGFTFLDELDQSSELITDSEQKAVASSEANSKEKHEKQPEDKDNLQVLQGIVQQKQSGQKGQNKFVKMSFKTNDGKTMPLLAHGEEKVANAMNLPENEQISIQVREENGFQFFLGLDQEVQKAG